VVVVVRTSTQVAWQTAVEVEQALGQAERQTRMPHEQVATEVRVRPAVAVVGHQRQGQTHQQAQVVTEVLVAPSSPDQRMPVAVAAEGMVPVLEPAGLVVVVLDTITQAWQAR
jgi:hypothetical protein